MDRTALIELVKSFGRFIYFGILGLVVTFLTALLTSGQLNDVNVNVGGMTVNLSFIILAAVTGVIKLIDRYRHVSENNNSNGLAPNFLQK